jgi:hypothetical protein
MIYVLSTQSLTQSMITLRFWMSYPLYLKTSELLSKTC